MGKALDLTNQRFGRLVALYKTDKRSGNNIMWHCICDCGNEKDINGSDLKKGKTKSCGCLQKEIASKIGEKTAKQNFSHNLLDITGQRYGRLVALKIDHIDRAPNKTITYWLCQCDCGKQTIVSIRDLRSGNTQSCGCLVSRGEEKIRVLLNNNNIPYETQKSFPDLFYPVTGYPARFDFYVNNQYLIQFDGKQHFFASGIGWNTEAYLKQTQQRDAFKNEYCKKHNIPLIRIPYTKLQSLKIEDLKLETSKFLI